MSVRRSLALALCLAAAACARPVPAARADYVGEWSGAHMRLVITPDGYVRYARNEGGARRSVSAPLQRFEGDNFVVGVGFVSTTFVVTRPPHHEGATWRMTVDGVELVRLGIPSDTYTHA